MSPPRFTAARRGLRSPCLCGRPCRDKTPPCPCPLPLHLHDPRQLRTGQAPLHGNFEATQAQGAARAELSTEAACGRTGVPLLRTGVSVAGAGNGAVLGSRPVLCEWPSWAGTENGADAPVPHGVTEWASRWPLLEAAGSQGASSERQQRSQSSGGGRGAAVAPVTLAVCSSRGVWFPALLFQCRVKKQAAQETRGGVVPADASRTPGLTTARVRSGQSQRGTHPSTGLEPAPPSTAEGGKGSA